MSIFVKVSEGKIEKYPYTYFDLISDYPNLSASLPLPLNTQVDLGVFHVTLTENPSSGLDVYEESDPVCDFGVWKQSWKKADLTEEQVSEIVDTEWAKVRSIRDGLLQLTDQTQLPDRPISEELQLAYANYRQDLRDITHQADPFNIEWPEAPE
jgi:hypothetical protein